jgi:TolB-like protein
VSKDTIMDAVWPNAVVEPNNLTVQIAALRRVLDNGNKGESCIQTAPGRGYRFALPVTRARDGHANLRLSAPRLSIVVLPFENLGGEPADSVLADAITDDLTSELTLITDVSVTAREAASAFHGQPPDVRTIGQELRVRYVVKGNTRRLGTTLRVNIQLICAESGTLLWSDRFDAEIERQAAQEEIIRRIRDELGAKLIDIESARSLRERPTNPDAFDLVLRARSIQNQPPSRQRNDEVTALLERALVLDPSSVYAMTYIAFHLSSHATLDAGWQNFDSMRRTERLVTRARELAPDSPVVLNTYVSWLYKTGRCAEAMELCQRAIRMYPNRIRGMMNVYHVLGRCKTWMGCAEEGIELERQANRLNRRHPWRFNRYRHIGWYSLLLGRDQNAVDYLEQSFAINPDDDGTLHWQYRRIAAAYARMGNLERTQQYLARAEKLWPFDTVRGRAPELLVSLVYVEQYRRFQHALRLSGLRDHADEDADFAAPGDNTLRNELAGFTPMEAPGAETIRTAALSRLIAGAAPLVIDTMTYSWGLSIPGAVGLKYAGLGGSLTDEAQDRLRSKMRELTQGRPDKPIVAVGWNSERFDGRNLALRLAALGYTQVYWYRGGREAWEVNGLPETTLDVQDW